MVRSGDVEVNMGEEKKSERRFLSGKEIRELLPTLFKLFEEKRVARNS
jgi:hypothetical protein